MAQLPDSGDVFVISRSHSVSPRPGCAPSLSRVRASSFFFMSLPCLRSFDPRSLRATAREETPPFIRTRTLPRHRSTPVLRFRGGELFLKRDSLTRRRQIAFRISIYTAPLGYSLLRGYSDARTIGSGMTLSFYANKWIKSLGKLFLE